MAQFNDFLSRLDLEVIRQYCLDHGECVRYAKGEYFAETGYLGKYVGFVKSGYFKYCTLTTKGDYAVTGFTFPDECIMDFTQSFVFSKPSKISIIAGNDAEVLQVRLHSLREHILLHHPSLLQNMCAIILEEAYRRYLNLYRSSPTERYLELTKKYPQVLECVTMRDLASYLLVTPVYLSRIRKNLGR